MNIYLDDSNCREALFPFTLTRHTADIRIGITTLREKWERITGVLVFTDPENKNDKTINIPSNILPNAHNTGSILEYYQSNPGGDKMDDVKYIDHPWQIFQWNASAIREDFSRITLNRKSHPINDTNTLSGSENIFVEGGAEINCAFLNAMDGPIYIGKNVTIMEGAMIRGPFAADENSVVKMGAKIYGGTTLGPACVAGGEIKNTVFFGNSNKAHDGYLGDSVIGEWCNFGAGTSNSNVKNTGGIIKYKIAANALLQEAGNKAGLLMGDYSRCAINTSFNTGSVVGVCCNIFGSMPAKYTADFSWGADRYLFDKAISDIRNWKQMKDRDISAAEIEILKKIYQDN